MALIDVYNAAFADSTVKQRFVGAVIVAAAAVMAESAATTNHANRLMWAAKVQTDPMAEAVRMYYHALSNSSVIAAINSGAAITDAAIQGVVDGYVNTFATGA